MSKSSKKSKGPSRGTQGDSDGSSFDENIELFFDILNSPIRTRSKESCQKVVQAIQKTKFYQFYERDLVNRPQVLYEIAQVMGCECFRTNSKIFDENQIAKKVYIIMEGEVIILSNVIQRETPREPDPSKKIKFIGKKEREAVHIPGQPSKAPSKPVPKTFEEKYPFQEEYTTLRTFDFFGDTDLRYRASYSFSAVTRKNTHVATIPADIFTKYLSEKTKILEEVIEMTGCDIFKFFPRQFVEHCLRFATEVNLQIGSDVFKEGDIANEVYFIKEGEIEFSMNPKMKIEEERRKLKEIKAKFGEGEQPADGFDELKFEKSSLYHKSLYEKGQTAKKSKSFWGIDPSSKNEFKTISALKERSETEKQLFQEKGLQVYRLDGQEYVINDDSTTFMSNKISQKIISEKYIKRYSSSLRSVEGTLERNEGVNGYKLFILSHGELFGEEELLKDSSSNDPLVSFSFAALRLFKLGKSSLLPENYHPTKDVHFRRMAAKCKSSHCKLLKISYQIFLSFVCMSHQELGLHKTLIESSRSAWKLSKIQDHVAKLRSADKPISGISTPSSLYSKIQQLSVTSSSSSYFENMCNSLETKNPTDNNNNLWQQPDRLNLNQETTEDNLMKRSPSKHQTSNSSINLTQNISLSPKILQNSSVSSPNKSYYAKQNFHLKPLNEIVLTKGTSTPRSQDLKNLLLEKVHIPQKRGFRINLEETDSTIHSPRHNQNSDSQQQQKQNQSQQQSQSFFFHPSKLSKFSNNASGAFSQMVSERQTSLSQIPQVILPNQTAHNRQLSLGMTSFEKKPISSKGIIIHVPSSQSIGQQSLHPSSLSITRKDTKHRLSLLLHSEDETEEKQQPSNYLSVRNVTQRKKNFSDQNIFSKNPYFSNPTSARLIDAQCENKIEFANKLSQRENILSVQKSGNQINFETGNNMQASLNEAYQKKDIQVEYAKQMKKSQQQSPRLNPISQTSTLLSSSSSSSFALKHLVGEIGKLQQNESPRKNQSEKNLKPERVHLLITQDFYNKKYRRAFNEASTIGQIQLKPQSFLLFSNQSKSTSEKDEKFLQLSKKHQIEKQFPESQTASVINDYIHKRVKTIDKQHQDSLFKIKMSSKDMNIKLFCEQLTRQVIQQENQEQQELEEASQYFNFTQGGRKPDV